MWLFYAPCLPHSVLHVGAGADARTTTEWYIRSAPPVPRVRWILSLPISIRLIFAFPEASIPREMVGRSGYAPSTFSSWGNHGDLADESALSPTSAGVTSTESPPWEGNGTIESRYAAAFTPGHTASSSSIDRNDPTAQRRFRGPIPKNMMDALHPGPADSSSSAILAEQLQRTRPELLR